MAKIRTVIVDDENSSRFFIKEELSKYENFEVIAEYENGLEGLKGINETKPDLVFVDIMMPQMNGFEMLKRLECESVIIFCTGYGKYALEAWEHNASDFITKPIEPPRFKRALKKAMSDIEDKKQTERLDTQRKLAGLFTVSWHQKGEKISRFFSCDDITFIEADGDYIKVFLIPGLAEELKLQEPCLTVKMTVKKVAKEWGKQRFKRAHRQYVVNFDKIISWNKSKMELRLRDVDRPISVGRTYMNNFRDLDEFII